MSKLMIALFVTAGLGFAGTAAAQMNPPMTAPISKASYTQAVKDADAQYKIDKDACSSLSGNAKDICVAEAKGKDSVAKADAEAAYENTPKAREAARVRQVELAASTPSAQLVTASIEVAPTAAVALSRSSRPSSARRRRWACRSTGRRSTSPSRTTGGWPPIR